MKKCEDNFSAKFRLLNTQKSSAEIIWSCSDSSDYENTSHSENHRQSKQTINRKRKRIKKAPKNISNLNITYSPLRERSEENYKTSPIFQKHIKLNLSPVQSYSHEHHGFGKNNATVSVSPVLPCGIRNIGGMESIHLRSPILISKHASPKPSPNVRKKLFTNNNNVKNMALSKVLKKCDSEMLNCDKVSEKPKEKFCTTLDTNCNELNNRLIISDQNTHTYAASYKTNCDKHIELINKLGIEENNSDEEINSDKISISSTSSLTLVEKVSSYFESHFSSESATQQSISEYESTPKNSSKTSEEIEFLNSLPESKNMTQTIKLENRSSSESLRSLDDDFNVQKSKKVRLKKDGLAFRLSVLTKKQKANISLWHHERYLAINSTFAIPNVAFTAFLIHKVSFQYGSYLLDTMDITDSKYLILINNIFVNNIAIQQDMIIKLYKPFRIIDCDSNCKIIVNVCKFECTSLKK